MTKSMTNEELAELERMLAKATPGPWDYTFRKGDDSEGEVLDPDGDFLAIIAGKNYARWRDVEDGGDAEFEANAALIVALRNAAPSLIATAREAEALRAENARLRESLRRIAAATASDVRAGQAGYVSRYGIHGIARAALEQGEVK